jgi:hypothetical protein
MSDLKNYVPVRKKHDWEFAEGFDEGYARFKIGGTLRKACEETGVSLATFNSETSAGHLVSKRHQRSIKNNWNQ